MLGATLRNMNKLPVFFSDKMVAHPSSFSPSAAKPAEVVDSWLRRGLPIEVIEPEPVTRAQLGLAHDARYVDEVLRCRRPNGFGDRSSEVASSLPWTSGAMLSAARHVVGSRGVACAPCSGFHHAGYDRGGGFCTFNGLMVTACVLHAQGCRRVGILDCDEH
jgi:acetoin utilization deacetylase AcuC-like enzyme